MNEKHIEALHQLFGSPSYAVPYGDDGFLLSMKDLSLRSGVPLENAYICRLIDEKVIEMDDVIQFNDIGKGMAGGLGHDNVFWISSKGSKAAQYFEGHDCGPLLNRLEALVKYMEAQE